MSNILRYQAVEKDVLEMVAKRHESEKPKGVCFCSLGDRKEGLGWLTEILRKHGFDPEAVAVHFTYNVKMIKWARGSQCHAPFHFDRERQEISTTHCGNVETFLRGLMYLLEQEPMYRNGRLPLL